MIEIALRLTAVRGRYVRVGELPQALAFVTTIEIGHAPKSRRSTHQSNSVKGTESSVVPQQTLQSQYSDSPEGATTPV